MVFAIITDGFDLIFFSNKNEGLLYELSILNCLQGKFKDMKKNLSKAFLKKPKNFELNKYIAGGLLRKTLENVSQTDIIGIYKKNTKCYNPMSRLVFRKGLFHSLKAKSKTGLYAIEFETPYLKKDLVRLKDNYGRKKKVDAYDLLLSNPW